MASLYSGIEILVEARTLLEQSPEAEEYAGGLVSDVPEALRKAS